MTYNNDDGSGARVLVLDMQQEVNDRRKSALGGYVVAGILAFGAAIETYLIAKYGSSISNIPTDVIIPTVATTFCAITSAGTGIHASSKANKLETEVNELMQKPEYQAAMQLHGRV